jgi:hypothetical protein
MNRWIITLPAGLMLLVAFFSFAYRFKFMRREGVRVVMASLYVLVNSYLLMCDSWNGICQLFAPSIHGITDPAWMDLGALLFAIPAFIVVAFLVAFGFCNVGLHVGMYRRHGRENEGFWDFMGRLGEYKAQKKREREILKLLEKYDDEEEEVYGAEERI